MDESLPGTRLPDINVTPAHFKDLGLNAADTSKFKPVGEPQPGIVSTGIMSEEERKNSDNLGTLTKEAVERNTNLTTSKTRSRIDGIEFSAIDPVLNPTSVEVTSDNKSLPQKQSSEIKPTENPANDSEKLAEFAAVEPVIPQAVKSKEESTAPATPETRIEENSANAAETKMISNAILKMDAEKQQFLQKIKEARKNFEAAIPDGFVTSEINRQKTKILIEPINESSYITFNEENGIMEASLTVEAQEQLLDQLLNPEKYDNPPKLDLSLNPYKGDSGKVIETIKKSQENVIKIRAMKEEVDQLKKEYDFTSNLNESLKSQQPPTTSSV